MTARLHEIRPPIQVRNLDRKSRINVNSLQRFAERAIRACEQVGKTSLNDSDFPDGIHVLLVSDRRMASLHQQFMNEPGPTDVITFHHGEIFVSVDTARRQARKFKTTLSRELELYIAHGLLHLCGFDDQTEPGRKRMRSAETTVIRRSRRLK